jgi:hypothetical protein
VSKRKAGDSENRPRYVALFNDEIDSMAFKTLSPKAVWLLVQLRRAWRGNSDKIGLSFAAVSWKLRFSAFDKARRELVEAGFLRVVDPGRRSPGGLNPAVYAPFCEGWRGEVAERLAHDNQAGYVKEIRVKDKDGSWRHISVWYPARPRSERQKAADNVRMAKMMKAKAAKKPARIPKVYLNRVRVAKLLEDRAALGKARELRNRN